MRVLWKTILLVQVSASAVAADHAPLGSPEILLDGSFGQLPVCLEEVFLSGSVSAATRVRGLWINGNPVPLDDSNGWRAILPLGPGRNEFTLKTKDAYDLAAERLVCVTAEQSFRPVRELAPRLALVPAIEPSDGNSGGFFSALFGELFRSRRYELLERERINSALNELALGVADLASPENMAAIGRLLLAEYVLTTHIEKNNNSLGVSCRLVDVGGQTIAWAALYQTPLAQPGNMDTLAKGIALDITRLLAVHRSIVLDCKQWPEVYLEGGNSLGITKGAKVLIVRNSSVLAGGIVVDTQDATCKALMHFAEPVIEVGEEVLLYGYMNPHGH